MRDRTARAQSDAGSVDTSLMSTGSRQSLLLPRVFECLNGEPPYTVLDVGAGVPETILFLSQYRCRVHFADLFDATELGDFPGEEADAYFDRVFAEHFSFPAGTQFDICLLWDFLNCLPVAGVQSFSRALRPFLHADSMGHGFGAFKTSVSASRAPGSLSGYTYGVRSADELMLRPRTSGLQVRHLHTRTTLAESLSCFTISRGTLLRDGLMELLMQAR